MLILRAYIIEEVVLELMEIENLIVKNQNSFTLGRNYSGTTAILLQLPYYLLFTFLTQFVISELKAEG